jgi:DNA polymerase elongation subunit (family B)
VFKKTKDPRQYSLKIQINAAYGLLGNPVFTHMYNHTSAADVTRIGRQWVKLARNTFAKAGYDVIYTDTDSVYVNDIFDDKEKLLAVKDNVIKKIKAHVPFPYEKFDMGVDAEITDIWFFKGNVADKKTDSEMDKMDKVNKANKLIKKNYIYRETDGSIHVKNLGVSKKSLSTISRKLFWEVLIKEIDTRRVVKFSETEIKSKIHDLLEEDLSLAATRFNIKPFDSYKLDSQMQAQIAKKHGSGVKFLIPVVKDFYDSGDKLTVGKDKKYILDSDFKKLGLKLDDIDLDKIWKELGYFIKDSQTSLEAFFS